MNTHGVRMVNGRHKGELMTRVPVSYLRWMANTNHEQAELAKAELDRRGAVLPEVEISNHAIDRASLRCRRIWHEDRTKNEGLHSWLVRVSMEALAGTGSGGDEICFYKGMKMVFELSPEYPVLKTIMPAKGA